MTLQKHESYRGNVNLKRENFSIGFSLEMQDEWLKCAEDPIYFIETYVKVISKGKKVALKLYDWQRDIILSYHHNSRTILATCRQAGKALPVDLPIPTPNGWKTMGELQVGDHVFDEHGLPVKITNFSPIFKNHDCYKITFDDKTSVISDAEHTWTVNPLRSKQSKDITTEELFKIGATYKDSRNKIISRWSIPLCKPLDYQRRDDLLIDPYLLGVWLGDGEAAGGRITCHNMDLPVYKKLFSENMSPSHRKDHIYTGTIYSLHTRLNQIGLIKNKHIPKNYLQTSVDNRIALLQGLMDTDGWVEKNGQNCIALSYNRYPQLIEDVYELLVGLGLKVFRKKYEKTDSERLYFHCSKQMFDVFRLPRKLDKQIAISQRPTYTNERFIRTIEKVSSVDTKCITVDSDSHLYLCSKHCIPTHNSTITVSYILWLILFSSKESPKTVAILANKADVAQEMVQRLQFAYESIPIWLQQGIKQGGWNKTSVQLENGSRVFSAATSKDSISGFTVDFLMIDEVAKIEKWKDFWTATSQTLSNNPDAKMAMISTPFGMNHFWEFWDGAQPLKGDGTPRETNGFVPFKITWHMVPGRDEAWKLKTLADLNFDIGQFRQEQEVEFLGSSGTLIAGWKLEQIRGTIKTPIWEDTFLRKYEDPIKDHIYTLIADVSRGKGLDHSAFSVFDVTVLPFRQVCTFRSNIITPIDYAQIIGHVGRAYNQAHILVEINDIGGQIVDALFNDYEYENIFRTTTGGAGRGGKRITTGSDKSELGVKTTLPTKNQGCYYLKLLLEQNKLDIVDKETYHELSTFSKKNQSWAAEPGKNDDLAMGLVLFGWLSEQMYFKEITNIDTIEHLRDKDDEEIMSDILPCFSIQEEIQEDDGDLPVNWLLRV